MRARNAAGDSGWRNSASAGPYQPQDPPATPTSVSVTRSDGALHASWPDVDGATSYHITFSSDNGASWSLAAREHASSNMRISPVDNGASYIVGVRAKNASGYSGWRNSAVIGPYTGTNTQSSNPSVLGMHLMQDDQELLSNLSSKPMTRVDDAWVVPLFMSASDWYGRTSVVRIVNRSDRSGIVYIDSYDASGDVYAPVELAIEGGATVHLNSRDLEQGNEGKGMDGLTGPARAGDWWLSLDSELALDIRSFVQHEDGFVTTMHEAVAPLGDTHSVPFIAGLQDGQTTRLRFVNPSPIQAQIEVFAVNANGERYASTIVETLPARGSATLTSRDLEHAFGRDLLADAANWCFHVEASDTIRVMNLLESASGRLANLSSATTNLFAGGAVVPLALPSWDMYRRQSLLRVMNHSNEAGIVRFDAYDDNARAYRSLHLTIDANSFVTLTSRDLESGNEAKGLEGGTGPIASERFRLSVTSDLDFHLSAYVRHADGFVTPMHDTIPSVGIAESVNQLNAMPIVAPASAIRLMNLGEMDVRVPASNFLRNAESLQLDVNVHVPAGHSVMLNGDSQ